MEVNLTKEISRDKSFIIYMGMPLLNLKQRTVNKEGIMVEKYFLISIFEESKQKIVVWTLSIRRVCLNKPVAFLIAKIMAEGVAVVKGS